MDEFKNLWNGFFIHIFPRLGQKFRIVIPPVRAMQQFVASRIIVIPVVAGGVFLAPIEGVRIIKAKLEAMRFAGGPQFLHGIAPKRSCLDDIVIGDPGIIHGEAVMMLGRNDEVAHARLFG